MKPLYLTHYTLTNALGPGVEASLAAMTQMLSGLSYCDFEDAHIDTYIGRVAEVEQIGIPKHLTDYDCRNNRLALLALKQDGFTKQIMAAKERYGSKRIGIFLGTSTSGIRETEKAYVALDTHTGKFPDWLHYRQQSNLYSLTEFVSSYFEIHGPAMIISTACSSSAKVFACASRYIQAGLCDAAIVGGVDSLCYTTLYGFTALELTSPEICKPFDKYRRGLSIGEAAGFALMEKTAHSNEDICLLGYGESSDAYHMSHPHPDGEGAYLAMSDALKMAAIDPGEIDAINLHGTATRANDKSEDMAISKLFSQRIPCCSTKGWTGHTLGAAGITEALLSALWIKHGFIPATLNRQDDDPDLQSNVLFDSINKSIKYVLSNSFGFGGTNCSLLFGRVN